MRAMATEGTNKPVQRDATADTDSATASGMAAAAQAAAQTDTGSGPSSASYDAAEAAGAQAAAGTTGYASTSAVGSCYDEDYGTGAPRLVVFGGNGFVGSRVCQEGLAMGAEVTSINRSGRPRHASGDWANRVDWVQASLGGCSLWVLCMICQPILTAVWGLSRPC
jgi:glutamate dehydrogenase/leucine dehydrogenase